MSAVPCLRVPASGMCGGAQHACVWFAHPAAAPPAHQPRRLLHFAPLQRHFHLEAILEDLVLSSQDPVATRLVQQLGRREMQVLFSRGAGGGSVRVLFLC